MTKKLFHIYYVEDGSPKIKSFSSEKALNKFEGTLEVDPYAGYWIELVIKGEIFYRGEHL